MTDTPTRSPSELADALEKVMRAHRLPSRIATLRWLISRRGEDNT